MDLGEHFWKRDDSENHIWIFLTLDNILSGASGRRNESRSQWTAKRLSNFSVHQSHRRASQIAKPHHPILHLQVSDSADQMAL